MARQDPLSMQLAQDHDRPQTFHWKDSCAETTPWERQQGGVDEAPVFQSLSKDMISPSA
jgi:hypothetical protein